MALNLFGPPTKDDIKVAYIDPILGLVEGVSICEANEYAKREPGTTFIFRNGNQTLQYLNVNEINQLDPNVLITTDECGGISQKKECGPPTIQIFGGGGIGAAGNPIVGNDGAILAVDIVRGGNGYQYPPLVSARDICNYGSGASFTTVIGEVVETTETFDNEADFEDYELCEPTDVGYGQNWGPDGEDLGSWDPKVYTKPGEDPIKKEVEEFEKIVRRLARAPFWTTRTAKPTKITCSDAKVIPSKYDVTDATFLQKQRDDGVKNPVGWNEFMNSYAISPVSPSNVRGSDFAGRLFTFEWTEDFPLDGEYIFRGLCDNKAQLYVDNLKVTDLAGFNSPVRPIQKTFRKGLHNIRVDLLNIPIVETVTTQTSTPSNSSNIQVKKVFNTLDFISKANRTLWRTNVYGRGGFINEVGVCPFDTSVTLTDNPYAGTHTIVWNNINFPIDGSYRIRMAVDDSVTLFIGDEQIRYEGFIAGTNTPNAEFSVNKFFKAGNYTVRADLEQISGGQFGFSDSRNINPMALAIDIEVTTITETIVSPKSWNENPMGISVTIDINAPEPTVPKEPVPEQEGRCPNNPIWTTRFPGAKEQWYPVNSYGTEEPQAWSKFMNRYAMSPVKPLDTPGSDTSGATFTNSWDIDIPYDGFYGVQGTRDNLGAIYIDSNKVSNLDNYNTENPGIGKVFITKGRHTIEVEVFNIPRNTITTVNQKIFRTKDWQVEANVNLTGLSGGTSKDGVTYEGPPLFAYKDNRWGTFMNTDSVSPFLPPLNADNSEINGVKTYSWKGVNFPESGQYDITFQADNDASLIINGIKVLSSQGYVNNPQIFKVNITQGKYDIIVDCLNVPDRTNIFRNNPTGFGLVIRKNVRVVTQVTSWKRNPTAISAILIPPPCPRRIRGKGIVTDIIVNDPGNGYLPPIAPTTTPPSTLALIQTNVPGVPGGGAGGGTGAPGVGVPAVPLSIPSPPSGAPTGINASFRPQFEVVRDPVVIDPQKLLQVTDLVGLKQTGYVNGRAYYGAVYYDKGIRYAGFYETVGEPIRVYDTLRESILAQVITPPSAILRQGTDIRSNDPLLNIPGTVQSTLSSNSIVGAGDIFPPSVPFVQEPVQDPIYPVSLRLKRVLVEDPGINYNVTDQIRIIPSNGAVLEPVFGSFGRIIKVAVIDPGFGFTEYPRIEMFTPL